MSSGRTLAARALRIAAARRHGRVGRTATLEGLAPGSGRFSSTRDSRRFEGLDMAQHWLRTQPACGGA